MPGGYQLPHYLKPITLTPVFRSEPLLRAAREVIGEVASVQAGETVLIVSDSSINPLLLEVFEQAILEKEAQVHVHSLPLPRASSTRTLLQKQHWRNWWPRETWNELRTADAVIALAYINPEFLKEPLISGQLKSGRLRFVSVTAVPELLATSGAHYPRKILDWLAEKVSQSFRQVREIRITDPAGTNLTFSPGAVAKVPDSGLFSFPYNVSVEVEVRENALGEIVSHAISTGFLPLLKLTVEEARLASVEGGGEVGELLRVDQKSSLRLQNVSWSMHPQSVRHQKQLSGSALIHNQLSSVGRAGAMRVGFWGEEHSQSTFFQIYFPSVWADGQEIIRRGYPLALEDPALIHLAESLGGKELLVVQCTVLPGTLPEPRTPVLDSVSNSNLLLPSFEILIRDVARIKSTEQVLIITDDSVSEVVVPGLQEALRKSGSQVKILNTGVPEAGTGSLILLEQVMKRTLSEDLKQAVADADVVLSPSYFHLPELLVEGEALDTWLERVHTRWVGVVAVPELLTSRWATYPQELLELLGQKVERELREESTVILSNNQGTSLIFDYQVVRADVGTRWSVFPTNIRYRLIPEPDSVEGIIVTSGILTGRVPRTEIHLGSGAVVEIEGTARTQEAVTQATAQGGLLDVSFGVHPKVVPVMGEVNGFSPRMWSHYAASQRSGVVSILLGSRFGRIKPLPLSLFFPLVNAGGPRIIINLGHLTALDDNEVRQLAERLGSIEALLEEEWIPALGE